MILIVFFLWTLILIVFCPDHDPCVKFMIFSYLKNCITRTFFFLWIDFCLVDCLLSCSFFPAIYFVCLCPSVDLCLVIGCVFVSLLICYGFVYASPSNHSYLFCLVFPPVWLYEFLPFPQRLPS